MPTASGEIYQFTVQGSLQGQIVENVFHMRERTGASTPAQLRLSMETLMGILSAGTSNTLQYASQTIKQMTPVAFDEDIFTSASVIRGAVTQPAINNTLALVITKRTGTAGKTHRGRMYIAGVPTTYVDTNRLTSTGLTNWQSIATGLITAFGPSGSDTHVQLGLYSRTIGGHSPFTVAGWQPVTRLDVQSLLGNQRRRREGVGI